MALNSEAYEIAERMIRGADLLHASVHVRAGVRVVDCGVQSPGGLAAGVEMALAAMAGRGRAWIEPADVPHEHWASVWPKCPWPVVAVESDQPLAACLASQYAGWKVSTKKYFAMASGPMRAAIGREELYNAIGMREQPTVAVGLLEASALPPEDVCLELAADARVDPSKLILLVARTASLAGTLQVIARSLETSLHKLHDLHFDLSRIKKGIGRAPLAPVPNDDLTAIGRTNDAILYGGHVVLEVTGDDESLLEIGPRMVSGSSADSGVPFLELFEKAGRDFYALDPALFAPAMVDLTNITTGRRHRFGTLSPDIVTASFQPRTTDANVAREA
jgi:methenyltetrahydromethanopterin cyclohydrolase